MSMWPPESKHIHAPVSPCLHDFLRAKLPVKRSIRELSSQQSGKRTEHKTQPNSKLT